MGKIIAFAGSNSSKSINHQLLAYIEKKMDSNDFQLINLSMLEIPMYGIDLENELGIPQSIEMLYQDISSTGHLLMSCSEHNGNMTAYMKSTLDWLSRKDRDIFKNTRIFLCGTSTGRSGATKSIGAVQSLVERLGGSVEAIVSLPSFNHVWENEQLIEEHESELQSFIAKF